MGVVFILISGAAFGVLPWFARIAYGHGAEPLGLLTARFTLAAIGLIVIRLIAQRGVPWPKRPLAIQLFLLGACGYAVQSSFYFFGIQRMDVSLATVIFYTYPVMVVFASWIVFHQRPSRQIVLCLTVVVFGAVLTAGQVKTGSLTGVLIMLAAAGWYTCYILVASKITHKAGALTSLTLVMIGAAVAHLAAWPVHQSSLPNDSIGWTAALGAAFISTIIGMGFFFAGVARIEPGEAAVLSTMEPVVSIAIGVIALNESLTTIQIVGALAVLTGVTLVAQLSRASEKKRSRADSILP